MTFSDKLRSVQRQTKSLLCVGLDVDPAKLPPSIRQSGNPILEFSEQIINATCDLVCAYKPNLAFFEALGTGGHETLKRVLELIPKSIITIGDAKRGDIGSTAERYVVSLFDDFGFDAATVNPYLGFDSIEPFLRDEERGVFLLALTSNPGSKDFQRLKVGARPLYERIVKKAKNWNTKKNLGLVVGATHPRELKSLRKLAPQMPFLIPGVGSQGGDLKSAVRFGCIEPGWGAVINASRSILYASSGNDFAKAARTEALRMRDEITALINSQTSW
jgi:orotidine-5'-phosphate decarboxylase